MSHSQQIPCELLWDGTRTSAMRGQRLINLNHAGGNASGAWS